jgi:hypothetical protein
MATHMPHTRNSRVLMLTTVPAAVVGVGAGLAVGGSTVGAVAIAAACVVLGTLSFLVAVRQNRDSVPAAVRSAGLVFLPAAVLLSVVVGVASGLLAGLFLGTLTVGLALYQIVVFGRLDAWLYRMHGHRVSCSPTPES